MIGENAKVIALCGGVGGAKLALGLSRVLSPEQLTIVVNTADDFRHIGLSISPDLDTVMYTLAGLNDSERGWGLAGESWNTMECLEVLGGETWFRLGDRDLATHLERTRRLDSGQSLTAVTTYLCDRLGVHHRVLPMSDDPVHTILQTAGGELAFQEYFVREQCRPGISGYAFRGIDTARPQPQLMELLGGPKLKAVVICPSNPFVSVDPILGLPGVRAALQQSAAPLVAVSPIVAGAAIKGPAAKMLAELGLPATALAVAQHYGNLLDGFVLDNRDAQYRPEIEALGIAASCEQTIMKTLADREDLARSVLAFAQTLERT